LPASQTVATVPSRPKSARASPQQCTQSAPDFIRIVSLLAELYPNACTPPNRPV